MGEAFDDETVTEIATDRPSRYAVSGAALIACILAVNVYRAVHQSITADEAFTYDLYIVTPFDWFLTIYNANNHILHTLLCRLSVQALGLSELTFRLPSLLGGLLYLVFVYKLCRRLFKTFWIFLLAMAAFTLNPFIMDYLSAARGYGMALGLFTGGLYLVLQFLDDPWDSAQGNRVSGAAILLGLSIAANLVFVFPAMALAGTLSVLLLADRRRTNGWMERLLWVADRVWLRMAAPALILIAIPLAHAHRNDFLFGTTSLRETARSLVTRSLFHPYDIWTPASLPGFVNRDIAIVTDWIVPLMLVVLLPALGPVFWRWLRERDIQRLDQLDRAYFLTAAVAAISVGMLVAAHAWAGVIYPSDRTAIYLVILVTLEWMVLVQKALALPHGRKSFGLLAAAPAVIAILLFLRGFTTSYYYDWRYDAGTKGAFLFLQQQVLEGHHRFNSANPMRVGADWRFNFSFNFYRHMYHADWMAPVERAPAPETGGFDYYVLLPEDEAATKKLALRVIYRDKTSGQEVAVAGKSPGLTSDRRF
jgi:hypothetical protein